MTAYHAARIRLSLRNRFEVRAFVNEETCGYEIIDQISGRVVERDTGYDGQWKADAAGRTALEMRQHPERFAIERTGFNCQLSTDTCAA